MQVLISHILHQVSKDYKLDYKEMLLRYLRMPVLKQKDVIQWIHGDLFLTNDKKNKKTLEDNWGRTKLNICRPDLKQTTKQWTGPFGEELCREACVLAGKNISKPVEKNGLRIDWETDDYMIEVKTGTFSTNGTAHEKILGVPYKYADVYELYGKPLKILCIGFAEKSSADKKYNFLKEEKSSSKQKLLDFYKKELHIEYQGFTDFLQELHLPLTLDSLNLSTDDTILSPSDGFEMYLEPEPQTNCS
jgi:hypothetical protein